jgi:hypothetical protein
MDMSDPASYLSAKIASMIGGFIGGSTILTFIRPKSIGEAFIRGGTSVGSAMIFSTPILKMVDMSLDWETQLMAGFCVGFVSYSLLGMIANFFQRTKNDDIIDVVNDIKSAISKNSGNTKSEK